MADRESSPEYEVLYLIVVGGEGGIRTHGNLAATHALQACLFVHSSTSPRFTGNIIADLMGESLPAWLLLCGLETAKQLQMTLL